jgi:hypothetical protein
MSAAPQITGELFERGPFPHFQKTLGLFRPVGINVGLRAALIVLIGWLPLPLLVVAQNLSGHSTPVWAFVSDFGIHARSLIAAPLFVLCEVVCLSPLEKIARNFVSAGLVRDEDRSRFDKMVASTRSLLNSITAEVVAIIVAYLITGAAARYITALSIPPWHFLDGQGYSPLSWAGRWTALVSLPLLLILLFSWVMRVFLWARFLFLVSRLNLRLVAAHPDHASGLRFLNAALYAFMPLAFSLAVIAAGSEANRVIHENMSVLHLQRTMGGVLVFVLLLFVGPLLVFIPKLHREKMTGIVKYGTLAEAVGRQFELKWLANYDKFSAGALEAPDFSATTDLYQVVSNVHDMTILPFDLRSLVTLIVTSLLPFIPVALMAVPLREIVKEIAGLLL